MHVQAQHLCTRHVGAFVIRTPVIGKQITNVESNIWHAASRRFSQRRVFSTSPRRRRQVTANGTKYPTDEWMNTPQSILDFVGRRLHLKQNHPLSITRNLIESRFPGYRTYNEYSPVVTSHQNFDSLDFPQDHPGRSRTDTYYFNKDTLLRTHTSAHQVDTFKADESDAWLITADVYRRDAIDRTHYPIFHQMEGAKTWDRNAHGGNITKAVLDDLKRLPEHSMTVEDPNPPFHQERNPLQKDHAADECEAVAAHLKRSLENVVLEIFTQAKAAAIAAGDQTAADAAPLRVRWVEAYFPFTSPSWELEIFWNDQWLEVLGCGVINQKLMHNADVPSRIGWAFGVGIERIAMLLFNIPDIRLFWSQDSRFLSQFDETTSIRRFKPFSKHPECYKDISFWVRSTTSSAGGGGRSNAQDFHENDIMEIVRNVGGDLVEDVRLVDEFTHPKTRRKSMCYRINYRSLERTLTNEEVNEMHARVSDDLVQKMGVEIR